MFEKTKCGSSANGVAKKISKKLFANIQLSVQETI